MLGAGIAITAMLNSLKNNKKLLRPKRIFLNQSKINYKFSSGKIEVSPVSEDQLISISQKHISESRKSKRKWSVVLVLLLIPVIILFQHVVQNQIQLEDKMNQHIYEANKLQYLELIADGDQWLQKRKWHNAIFQYKKAKEIFPMEFDIHYRLAYVYGLRCENEFLNCKDAKKELDILLEEFPKKSELESIKKILEYEYQ